ncbi:MAG: DUF2935 domain-containing protein [Clostridiales bacterium]|nr:DUF2935 domain-containing protein [Clostridiales bacterium]
MLSSEEFIRISLEINLFFQRIMKEHLFFIEINLQPVQSSFIAKANELKLRFERLLEETVIHANGIITKDTFESNEFVTPYTLKAEELNSKLTGASINIGITKAELGLANTKNSDCEARLESIVWDLNNRSINALKEVIAYKKKLLDLVSECKIFITLYDEMLEHVTEEAEYYLKLLQSLQKRKIIRKPLCEGLNFWNHIMSEHAEFIDGMLDPTEDALKKAVKTFAVEFEKLVKDCITSAEKDMLQKSLKSTENIKDFKGKSTEGLLACKIKSIIPPLLADHVLREANHYLRILMALD